MDPISKFTHDAEQYVYQPAANVRIVPQGPPPTKPFEINAPEKSKKTKKDMDKKKQQEDKNKA